MGGEQLGLFFILYLVTLLDRFSKSVLRIVDLVFIEFLKTSSWLQSRHFIYLRSKCALFNCFLLSHIPFYSEIWFVICFKSLGGLIWNDLFLRRRQPWMSIHFKIDHHWINSLSSFFSFLHLWHHFRGYFWIRTRFLLDLTALHKLVFNRRGRMSLLGFIFSPALCDLLSKRDRLMIVSLIVFQISRLQMMLSLGVYDWFTYLFILELLC